MNDELQKALADAVETARPEVRLLSGRLYRGTPDSAGYDLYSAEDVTLRPGEQKEVRTGVRTVFPPTLVALIRDRSSWAKNRRLTTRAGVIDADYRDEWRVLLVNEDLEWQTVLRGDRVAQVVFLFRPDVNVVGEVVIGAERIGGFGSTGT